MIESIAALLIAAHAFVGSLFGFVPVSEVAEVKAEINEIRAELDDTVLGAYSPTGGKAYRLKSSIGTADTTINLSSFKEPISEIPYTMAYLNTSVGYGTIEPLTTDRSEFISFTGITQNSDGSAQLTGVTRGLSRSPMATACTASTTLAVRHPAQSIFIYTSDSPCHFAEYAVKRNDETISGSWTVPTPTASGNPTTKAYVDALVNGGTVSTDSLIVAATAGETVSSGQILYYNRYDAEWLKADADVASTSRGVLLGVAQGAGTDGVSINGGVLIRGLDTKNTGGTPGAVIYISGTAGATSTTPGSVEKTIGVIRNASTFYFDPNLMAPTLLFSTNKVDDNQISTTTILLSDTFGPGTDGDVTIAANSTTTLTRDMYYDDLVVNGSIVTNNWRVFVKNSLSGTGNFTSIGTDGAAGTAGSGTTRGTGGANTATTTSGFFMGCAAGGGSFGGLNSTGSNGTSTQSRYSTFHTTRSGAGGDGGAGNANAGGTGGSAGMNLGTTSSYAAGTIFEIFSASDMSTSSMGVMYRLSNGAGAGGGGGGGSSTGSVAGGGGGAGGTCGGVVFLAAKTMGGTFNIYVTGGNGGAGGAGAPDGAAGGGGGGGGGGGKGGTGIRIYSNDVWGGTCNANGGSGGGGGASGGPTGVAGSSGSSGGNGYCIGIDVDNLVR